jgi:3,4-dihydroxy 2-butanone 4-phosphate synthase/GTP cyclohydrolase II
LILGNPSESDSPVLVRVQHQAVIGDALRSTTADAGWQLHGALKAIADAGAGVLVYLHKKEAGRVETIRQYLLNDEQKRALETNFPDLVHKPSVNRPRPEFRDLGVGAQILRACGVTRMKLLSNSDRNFVGLDAYGLDLVGTHPIPVPDYRKA